MKIRHTAIGVIGLVLAGAVALAVWLPVGALAAQQDKNAQGTMQMQHITTQTQAEALKPGDFVSMACSTCKNVMIRTVTTDKANVTILMTAGGKDMCDVCRGTVTVVATGKGTGKDADVKHVCSQRGDDAMFCSATTPGSGSMKDMGKGKK